MKIGIDVRLMYGRKSGIGVYLTRLVKELCIISGNNNIFLFYKEVNVLKTKSHFFEFFLPVIVDYFHKQFILPIELIFKKINIFFAPCQPAPFFCFCPVVAVIHDVGVRENNLFSRIHNISIYFSLIKAAKIIVPSEFTKKELIRLFNISPDKISVIYHGVPAVLYLDELRLSSGEWVKNYLGISKKIILTVLSSLSKYKNLESLVKAYAFLPLDIRDQYVLTVVTPDGRWDEIKNNLKDEIGMPILDSIYVAKSVSDEELNNFYAAADIFVFPSIFEGFGYPIIEAMSFGLPVIVGNRTSCSEIAGDAALIVDPLNPSDITEKMLAVIQNAHVRLELITKSLKRAEFFSLKSEAEETMRVLRSVYKEKYENY